MLRSDDAAAAAAGVVADPPAPDVDVMAVEAAAETFDMLAAISLWSRIFRLISEQAWQNHLPLGAELRPTHVKWNHCVPHFKQIKNLWTSRKRKETKKK